MGTLLNRRRYMGASKQAKTLFEMYNQYFDGTVNSVVNTGLKLWNGTHNRWKMEVEYDAITAQYANKITLFSVKPDVTPYSGIRVRKEMAFSNNCDFTLTVGEACTVISNPGEFSFGTNSYGSHLYIGNTNSVNSFTLIRDGQYLYCDYNGQLATLKITDPRPNNLNLLIGCDYKGANNETQRYYTGTVHKFVISELGDSHYDAEIEYLQFTGTQYIGTGFVPDGNSCIEVVCHMTANETIVCGSSLSYNKSAFELYIYRSLQVSFGNSFEVGALYYDSDSYYKQVIDKGVATTYDLSGNVVKTFDFGIKTFTCPNTMFIGALHRGNTGQTITVNTRTFEIKSFVIKDNDVVVRDYIPVRVGQTGYMYDRVSGTLFGNNGTGDFVLGPDKT